MFYGWWLIATGMVAVAIMSGIAIWSITLYVEPLENQFGWSRAAVALGPSMAALTGGVASPFIGRWTDIRGPREVIGVGVLISVGGFLLLSTTDALWQWLFYNGLLGVGIALAYFIPFQALASRWFDRRRGMAIGLLGVGISCGGIVVVPIVQVMIDAFGWQGAFIFSGALQGAWMLPLVLFVIRDAPADVGALVDGEPAPLQVERTVLAGVSLQSAMRTPLFWTLTFAIGLFFFGAFGWVVHAVPFYQSEGASNSLAVSLVVITVGAGVITRLAGGWLVDRTPSFEFLAMVMAGLGGLAMVSLLAGPGLTGVAPFIVLWAWSNVGPFMLEPLSLTRAFGLRHFATIAGVVTVMRTFFQLLGPFAAGLIFDATDDYDWALAMFICSFGLSVLLFFVAMRLPRPSIAVRA